MTSSAHAVYAQDQEPEHVTTAAQLDRLLDRIAAQAPPDAPPLVALDMPERQRTLVVGQRGPVGVLNFVDFSGTGGSVSKADTSGTPTPAYFYCDQWTGLPADAEIPIERVRAAAREYLTTGERPTGVEWQ